MNNKNFPYLYCCWLRSHSRFRLTLKAQFKERKRGPLLEIEMPALLGLWLAARSVRSRVQSAVFSELMSAPAFTNMLFASATHLTTMAKNFAWAPFCPRMALPIMISQASTTSQVIGTPTLTTTLS